jgi:NADH-quinone oxidoreductase subunit N
MIVVIFSMSGIPPFAGFYAKYDILYTLFNSLETFILFLVLLLSVISFFYYLRIIKILNFDVEHKITSQYTFVTKEK